MNPKVANLSFALATLILSLALSRPVNAQIAEATLSGTITDPSGKTR